MARARTPRPRHASPFVLRTLALAPADDELVRDLSRDATDSIGRAISRSAVVRALLRYTDQQGPSWVTAQLFP